MTKERFELDVDDRAGRTTNHKTVKGVQRRVDEFYDHVDKVNKAGYEKALTVAQERAEARRLVSLANKRLRRMESNNLEQTPAYQAFIAQGGQYFSVRGKTPNEVRQELAKMRRFIDAETSTVRGAHNHLKNMASITGMKYKNLSELKQKAPKFFELSNKIEQYLRNVHDMASAISYDKIWTAINQYTQAEKINLADADAKIDDMIEAVTHAMKEFETPTSVDGARVRLKK